MVVHEEDHEWNQASEHPYSTDRKEDDLETESLVGPVAKGRDEGEVEEYPAE